MEPIKVIKSGELECEVYADRGQMGKAAAICAAEHIGRVISEKGEANVIFAAAPSQNEMLEALLEQGVDFSRVNAFHMDEYIGLSLGDPRSFSSYLTEHIWKHAGFKSVNIIDGSRDMDEVCREYTALLEKYPPDCVCMGIGENGHIAFNDPPVADLADPLSIKPVKLDEICRMQQVHDGCFPTLDDVPRYALTLTVPMLMSARYLVCTVPAETKAEAVYRTLNWEISEKCPATAMRRHPGAKMFLDAASASRI